MLLCRNYERGKEDMLEALVAYLTSHSADLCLSWAKEKVGSWWKTTAADEALRTTADEFPDYSALDATLREWAQNSQVAATLLGMAEGVLPTNTAAPALVESFVKAGFQAAPNQASSEQVLTAFFKNYHRALLQGEGVAYSVAVVTRQIKVSEERTAAQIERLQKSVERVPLLGAGADIGLLPGATEIPAKLSEAIEAAKQLIEEGKASAALELLRVHEVRQGEQAPKLEVYELLATRANALVQLGRMKEAESEFRAALRLRPARANALANVGRALLYQGDVIGALGFAEQALAKESANPSGLNVKAQALARQENFDDAQAVAALLPETADREYLRGSLELWAKRPREALSFMKSAVAQDPENAVYKAGLARAIMTNIQATLTSGENAPWGRVSPELRADIDAAEGYLTEAIEALRQRDDLETLGRALMDRAGLRAYMGNAKADDDYTEALDRGFNDAQAVHEAVVYWLPAQKVDKAIQYLQKYRKTGTSNPDIELLLGQALLLQGKIDEALRQLDQPSLAGPEFAHATMLARLDALLKRRDAEAAEAMLAGLPPEERALWDVAVREAEVHRLRDNPESAVGVLRAALEAAEQKNRWRLRLALAQDLMPLEQWDEAATLFGQVLTADGPAGLLRMYLICLNNADLMEQCLAFAKEVREARGVLPGIAEIEADALAALGHLNDADRIYQQLAVMEPDEARWKLKRAVVAIRQDDRARAAELLPQPKEAGSLSTQDGASAAQIRSLTGDFLGALEAAYWVLRSHPDDPAAHMQYVGTFFSVDSELEQELHSELAAPGTWVNIESEDGPSVHEVLEEGENPTTPRQHRSDSPFSKAVLGKKVGEEIVLVESTIGRKPAKITAIRHKYVGLFQETIQGFNSNFPGESGLQGFNAGQTPDFEPLKRSLAERSQHIDNMVEQYGKLPVPISTIAKMLGKSDLDVWLLLVSGEAKQPLLVADGSEPAQREALEIAVGREPAVIELTSAIALKELGLLEELEKLERSLFVAQSTLDQIDEIRAGREFDLRRRGTMTVWAKDGQFFKQEVSPAEIQRSIRSLEEIASWLRAHTAVSGVVPRGGPGRRETQEMMSRGAYDSILLAREVKGVIVSEDLRLRAFGRGEFGLKGVASFHLLQALVQKEAISIERYDEAIVQMIVWHYEFVPFTPRTIIRALVLDKLATGFRFRAVIQRLVGPGIPDTQVVQIAAQTIREVTVLGTTEYRRRAALHVIFDAIAQRGWARLEAGLVAVLRSVLSLHPFGAQEVLREINAWKRARLLP